MIYEGTIAKAWNHQLDGDGGTLVCFTLDDVTDRAFWGADEWLPLLNEAVELRTRVRVMFSEPEAPEPCGDPHCGDGCCDDPDCMNVPEEERTAPYLVRADTLEWM